MTSPYRQGRAAVQSRPRAAFSRLSRRWRRLGLGLGASALLAGCASGGASPAAAILGDALSDPRDLAGQAAEIPFASLVLDAGDRRGLVVLGAEAAGETYWPAGDGGLVTLRHEGLHATAGLPADLLDSDYRGPGEAPWRAASPAEFAVTRTWQDADGLPRRLSARGRLRCEAAQPVELPLATLALERCAMTLRWENGATTAGVLWREPHSRRLWAGEEQAWPEGPTIRWEVARQWW
ncbi:YjbF family lipoprotein [Halomonas sp. PBN3]|uniref:YjbF family lipoprotein n=1 Tax=Halomonas sp. PBN3 TaxID=1397528 RepID=UPI0003B91277|nr:YjbF family lipoprotein [Halomonas sp. PBN3]ERS91443.1 hypothetical protein Q671_16515 [Halomonas sp. PBN3]